jgi:carbamate kinase
MGGRLMLVVVALGGEVVRSRVEAIRTLAGLAAEHHMVLACGWGADAALASLHDSVGPGVPTYPLEVLDSEAERAAGHRFEQALARCLPADRLARVVTRVVVDADDPAFVHPSTVGRSLPTGAGSAGVTSSPPPSRRPSRSWGRSGS